MSDDKFTWPRTFVGGELWLTRVDIKAPAVEIGVIKCLAISKRQPVTAKITVVTQAQCRLLTDTIMGEGLNMPIGTTPTFQIDYKRLYRRHYRRVQIFSAVCSCFPLAAPAERDTRRGLTYQFHVFANALNQIGSMAEDIVVKGRRYAGR